jgi:tetratricopeptide (TPR) repeat protein
MPKAIKKRVSKKPIDSETEVKQKISSLTDAFRHRQKIAFISVITVVVALIVVVSILWYSHSSQQKAKILENEAYKAFYSAAEASATTPDEQYRKALNLFTKAYDTRKSPFSLFYIANSHYALGNYDDSLKTLQDFIKKYATDENFLPLAYQKMSLIYLRKGETEHAKRTLDDLYNMKSDILKDFALMESAKLFEKEGQLDEAQKKYQELVKKYPSSPFIEEAKAKISGKPAG